MVATNEEISKPEPPFPWIGMGFLCLGMLAHSVVFTSPLPYVAYMVVDFKMTDNLDEAGYTAGWITGMFMMGRTIAGVPWGIAADTYGRKMCLFISMVNVAVLGVLFGFSTSFAMAVSLRFLIGLGNGFMGVCKTVVTEMVSCKEHEVRAFGYINGVWGLGLIVGPAIGGLLSRPAIQYPDMFAPNSIWGQYPYLLPSLICAFIAVLAAIGSLLFVPETLKKLKKGEKYEKLADQSNHPDKSAVDSEDDNTTIASGEYTQDDDDDPEHKEYLSSFGWNQRRFDLTTTKNALHLASVTDLSTAESKEKDRNDDKGIEMMEQGTISTASLSDSESLQTSPIHSHYATTVGKLKTGQTELNTDDESEDNDHEVFRNINSPALIEAGSDADNTGEEENTEVSENTPPKKKLPASLQEIVRSTNIQFLFVVYMCYCFLIMYIDETFPLWCVTSVSNGGLGWDSAEVGTTLASIGLGLVIFQVFFYEWMIRKYFNFGPVETYFRLLIFSATFMIVLPLVSDGTLRGLRAVLGDELHTRSSMVLRFAIVGTWLLYRIPATSAFSTLAMVVNGSVDQCMRGTMNGLIMTAGSVGNFSGPVLGSTVYAVMLALAYGGDTQHKQPLVLPIDGRIVFVSGGLMAIGLAYLTRAKMVVNETK